MDRRRQYELLPDGDEEVQPLTASTVTMPETVMPVMPLTTPSPPPGYSSSDVNPGPAVAAAMIDVPLDQPPAYNVAIDLPSYEECLRAKQLEEEQRDEEAVSVTNEISPESRRRVDSIIGTDGMFVLGFVFAFLFNWVGLVAAFCLMRTCAGRFGALSGFGLSLVKWVAIAKRNNWSVGMAEENPWVWWLLVSFGILISCSGTLQYLRIKYMWSRTRNADVVAYPF